MWTARSIRCAPPSRLRRGAASRRAGGSAQSPEERTTYRATPRLTLRRIGRRREIARRRVLSPKRRGRARIEHKRRTISVFAQQHHGRAGGSSIRCWSVDRGSSETYQRSCGSDPHMRGCQPSYAVVLCPAELEQTAERKPRI